MSSLWIDGALVDKNHAKVSVFDHGFLYGDGVWEGMRAYGGTVFRLKEHLDTLFASAAAIALRIPLSMDELTSAITTTLRANGRTEGYIRIIVTRGAGTLGLDPRKCEPSVLVIAEEIGVYPRELAESGLAVISVVSPRPHPPVILLSRAGFVAAKATALRAGCFEALMFDSDGSLIGATEAAAFVVSSGSVGTVNADQGGPDPVMQAVVLELVEQAGLPRFVWPISRASVLAADELFLASAAGELVAVTTVDGQPIGSGRPGPLTQQLREHFQQLVRG